MCDQYQPKQSGYSVAHWTIATIVAANTLGMCVDIKVWPGTAHSSCSAYVFLTKSVVCQA